MPSVLSRQSKGIRFLNFSYEAYEMTRTFVGRRLCRFDRDAENVLVLSFDAGGAVGVLVTSIY